MSNTLLLTQVKASTIASRLKNLGSNILETTVSLAYHTFSGNLHAMKGAPSDESRYLDSVYRQFVCAKFDKTKNKWVFNAAKAKKMQEDLGLASSGVTFDTFVDAICASISAKEAAKEAAEIERKALTPTEQIQAKKDKVLAYLVKSGLTEVQLKDLVHIVEQERTSKGVSAPVLTIPVDQEPSF